MDAALIEVEQFHRTEMECPSILGELGSVLSITEIPRFPPRNEFLSHPAAVLSPWQWDGTQSHTADCHLKSVTAETDLPGVPMAWRAA